MPQPAAAGKERLDGPGPPAPDGAMTPDALESLIRTRAVPGARLMVAIAGPPGAGKSTLADRLAAGLGPLAAVVPMDGYHFDNALLDARGLRGRKGAPMTFDVAGLARDLARVREREPEVLVPVFDRAADLSRAAARAVPGDVPVVLVEGNYLLLDLPPWDRLAGLFDLTVMLDVPEADLERRLVQRWLDHGLAPQAAQARAMGNDLPNARTVRDRSRKADVVLAG
jgi:pantothenate kinase